MSTSVRRRNPNAIDDLIKFAKKIEKRAVYVGYPASAGGEMVMRASVHQFGSIERNIPPRPFLSEGVKNGEERYKDIAKRRMSPVLLGKVSVEDYHKLVGTTATAEVKKYIREGDFAPLSPMTIKRKGSSKPLIDTGQMRNTVTYEVRDNE